MREYLKLLRISTKKAFKHKLMDDSIIYNYVIKSILNLALFYYINHNTLDFGTIILSVCILIIWSNNVFDNSFLIINERELDTLHYFILSPFSMQFLLLFQIGITLFLDSLAVGVILLVSRIFFNFSFEIISIPYYFLSFLLCAFSISTVGLLLSVSLLYTRSARGIVNVIEYPLYILSGLFVPIEKLPGLFRFISSLFPTTYAIDIFKNYGNFSKDVLLDKSLKCIVLIVIFNIITHFVFKISKKRILANSQIDKF